jgi:tRNA-binding protein
MPRRKNPFPGRWRIVQQEQWDQEFVDMETENHYTLEKDQFGSFQFGLQYIMLDKSVEDLHMKNAPVKKTISFEDFEKVDIRVGTIKSVLDVSNSNKLMKLIVDFGDHTRSIIAGIKKERTNPREIEGKQALFVVNLPEKKMAGEVSQGMLFDIGYADKITPCLAVPEKHVPNGVRAG